MATAAKLSGNLFKFTWTPGGSGETISTTRGFQWSLQAELGEEETTPEQTIGGEEWSATLLGGMVVASFNVHGSDATPPIPTGALGTATLFPDYTVAGKKYTATARCVGMALQTTSRGGRRMDVIQYRFRITIDPATPLVASLAAA